MTEEEVEKYIAQLAFSGAKEFVQKSEKNAEVKDDIIGKFGLGFILLLWSQTLSLLSLYPWKRPKKLNGLVPETLNTPFLNQIYLR